MRLFKSKTKKEHDSKVQLILCYHANSFAAKDVAELIKKESFGFIPAFIETDEEPVEFGDHYISELEGMSSDESDSLMGVGTGVTLSDEQQELEFKIIHPGRKNRPQVIYWTIKDLKVLKSQFLQNLLNHEAFTAGYCADLLDMRLQSEKNIGIYKSYGIKPEFVSTNEYGDKVVDVSKNPGRKKLVQHFWLTSCWKMWFGKKYQELVERDNILGFDKAEIQSYDSFLEVTLYENPFDYSEKKNRAIQQEFRDYIGLDVLERQLR
ncbi:MAG: hypothetical protein NXI20_18295 [bacterium]|nr:hypothetical protein [bacterium]